MSRTLHHHLGAVVLLLVCLLGPAWAGVSQEDLDRIYAQAETLRADTSSAGSFAAWLHDQRVFLGAHCLAKFGSLRQSLEFRARAGVLYSGRDWRIPRDGAVIQRLCRALAASQIEPVCVSSTYRSGRLDADQQNLRPAHVLIGHPEPKTLHGIFDCYLTPDRLVSRRFSADVEAQVLEPVSMQYWMSNSGPVSGLRGKLVVSRADVPRAGSPGPYSEIIRVVLRDSLCSLDVKREVEDE